MPVINQSYGLVPSVYRSLSSLVSSFYHKMMSIVFQCLGQKDNHREHTLLSKFYWERASTIVAYSLYGDSLLSPSVNMERTKSLVRPNNLKKIDDCYKMAIEKNQFITTPDRSKYPKEKITKGICSGFSLKFISKYLQAIRDGQDPQTAIRALGEKYKEGGTERTAIVHGLETTITTSNELESIQIPANLFQIDLTKAYDCKFTSLENAEDNFATHLNNLEDGAYYVWEHHKNPRKSGHVIAYIKHQNSRFIFDPNLGVVQIPKNKDAEYLIKNLESISGNRIAFFKASLQSYTQTT